MNMLTHPNPFKGDLLKYINRCIERVDSAEVSEYCKIDPWKNFLLYLDTDNFYELVGGNGDWRSFYRASYCNTISYSFFTSGILMSDGTYEPKIENLYTLVYNLRYMDIKSERSPIL